MIFRLEGLVLSNSLRRALRGRGAFGRRAQALVDNAGLSLAAGKGRSAAFQIRDVLREICALTLACHIRASVRWAPSG